jgi:hypothetical protein
VEAIDNSSMSLHRCALKLLEQCHEWGEHELSVRKEAQGRSYLYVFYHCEVIVDYFQ